jgi:hypothetical protein
LILDLKTQIEKDLAALPCVSAVFASLNLARLSPEDVIQQILLARVLQQALNSIESNIQELLGVLLLSHVRPLTIVRLVAVAQRCGVVVLTVREDQMPEHAHHLVQKVVVESLIVVLLHVDANLIICAQETVSEGGNIEKLLHHGVHVADGS